MLQQLIRPELLALKPYETAGKNLDGWIILDGNENPYTLPEIIKDKIIERFQKLALNRYPCDDCRALREKIGDYLQVVSDEILVGNGSDELLQNLIQTFIEPGDWVCALGPTFSMYKIFTHLQRGLYAEIPLDENGAIQLSELWQTIEKLNPKVLILCSPNNPTGTRIPLEVLREIADRYQGILVIDEAYAEFCSESMVKLVKDYSRLVVTRTFSKAFGLAGVRLGYLVGHTALVAEVSKVQLPYHLNSVTQIIGEILLSYMPLVEEGIGRIVAERERLWAELSTYPGWRVYPSEANFLFLRGRDVVRLGQELEKALIRVRKFASPLDDAIRLTVGSEEENNAVLRVVRNLTASL